MSRVKRGKNKTKRRRRLLKRTKGFRGDLKSKKRTAKQSLFKAGTYAYRDRRNKKREMRRLWQIKINAACRQHGLSYSKFICQLKKNKIELDRKVLAEVADKYPEIFAKIIEKIK